MMRQVVIKFAGNQIDRMSEEPKQTVHNVYIRAMEYLGHTDFSLSFVDRVQGLYETWTDLKVTPQNARLADLNGPYPTQLHFEILMNDYELMNIAVSAAIAIARYPAPREPERETPNYEIDKILHAAIKASKQKHP
jgi:hypothetical protein